MNFLVKILLGGISVIIAEYLIPGIHIDTAMTGFILAAVIILINLTLKPILIILTLPITILTLGLFVISNQCADVYACRSDYSGISGGWILVGSIVCNSGKYY